MVRGFVVQFGAAVLFALVGWYYWRIAERFCEQMRERRAKTHRIECAVRTLRIIGTEKVVKCVAPLHRH